MRLRYIVQRISQFTSSKTFTDRLTNLVDTEVGILRAEWYRIPSSEQGEISGNGFIPLRVRPIIQGWGIVHGVQTADSRNPPDKYLMGRTLALKSSMGPTTNNSRNVVSCLEFGLPARCALPRQESLHPCADFEFGPARSVPAFLRQTVNFLEPYCHNRESSAILRSPCTSGDSTFSHVLTELGKHIGGRCGRGAYVSASSLN